MTNKQLYNDLTTLVGSQKANDMMNSWLKRVVKKAKKDQSLGISDSKDKYYQVLDDLKEKTGISFRLGKEVIKLIQSRFNNNNTFEDFQKVHFQKARDWLNDPKMIQYLTPETLYRPSNFSKYLNQFNISQSQKSNLNAKKQKVEFEHKRKVNQAQKQKIKQWFEFSTFESMWSYRAKLNEEEVKRFQYPQQFFVAVHNWVVWRMSNRVKMKETEENFKKVKNEKLKT